MRLRTANNRKRRRVWLNNASWEGYHFNYSTFREYRVFRRVVWAEASSSECWGCARVWIKSKIDFSSGLCPICRKE